MSDESPAGAGSAAPGPATSRPTASGPTTSGPSTAGAAGRALPEGAVPVRVRRAPKYAPFVVTGVVVGVLLGVVVAFAYGDPAQTEELSRATLARYFAAALGLFGAVLGAVAALLLERRRR